MAKISRTPYNGARYVTRQINNSFKLNAKMSGEAIFVDAQQSLELSIPFLNNGAYFRIILKNRNEADVRISIKLVNGVVFSDDGNETTSTTYEGAQVIVIPTGRAAGSFVDVICDGERWYAQGLLAIAQ